MFALPLLTGALVLGATSGGAPASDVSEVGSDSASDPDEVDGETPDSVSGGSIDDRCLPGISTQPPFAAAPDIALVQAWTMEHAGLDGDGTRALMAAARARGALPRIRLGAGYDDDERVDRDAFDRMEDHRETSAYSLDLQLEWDLAELAAGVDTYRAVREGRAQLELRHALVTEATSVYFDRLRLLVDEETRCTASVAEVQERRLRVLELDATLDGLTGGRWREALEGVSEPHLRLPTPAGALAPAKTRTEPP